MCQISSTLKINQWERAAVGDVVLVQQGNVIILGEAKMFVAVSIDNAVSVVACLHRWDILSDGLRSWKCRRRPTPFSCMADEIVCSVIWGGSDVVTVLKPHRV